MQHRALLRGERPRRWRTCRGAAGRRRWERWRARGTLRVADVHLRVDGGDRRRPRSRPGRCRCAGATGWPTLSSRQRLLRQPEVGVDRGHRLERGDRASRRRDHLAQLDLPDGDAAVEGGADGLLGDGRPGGSRPPPRPAWRGPRRRRGRPGCWPRPCGGSAARSRVSRASVRVGLRRRELRLLGRGVEPDQHRALASPRSRSRRRSRGSSRAARRRPSRRGRPPACRWPAWWRCQSCASTWAEVTASGGGTKDLPAPIIVPIWPALTPTSTATTATRPTPTATHSLVVVFIGGFPSRYALATSSNTAAGGCHPEEGGLQSSTAPPSPRTSPTSGYTAWTQSPIRARSSSSIAFGSTS